MMSNQILNYLGKSHASHIHARGKVSTDKLIELLAPQKDEYILEVGFGTGTTLVQMAAHSEALFCGYDLSPIMHQKALQRIQACHLTDRINVHLLDTKNQFPAPDNSFDCVYAESILAIQEGDDLKASLLEIKRVLKPKGRLLFNETIWLDTTSKNRAEQINDACKESFGIIQANHDYPHVADWLNLLTELGFQHEITLPVSEIQLGIGKTFKEPKKSSTFTLKGKIKAKFSPTLRKSRKNFEAKMATIIDQNEKLMEGMIVKAVNKK